MMKKPRVYAWQQISRDMRATGRRVDDIDSKLAALNAERDELADLLAERATAETERFGVHVTPDPMMLDVLNSVVIDADGSWRWLGGTNNHGVPQVRHRDAGGRYHSRTVVRVLAEYFGVVERDEEVMLYPTNGQGDVNPWHRKKRGQGSGHKFTKGSSGDQLQRGAA